MQDFPIYSESSLSDDSESTLEILKCQVFIEISEKTSFDFSKYSSLPDSVYSRTPLGPKDTNIQLSETVANFIRKPNQKVSWACIKKWQKSQPNDYISISPLFSIYLLY